MGKRYLIDTNIISHLFSDTLPENGKEFVRNIIDTELIISVIVEIEILTYQPAPEKMLMIEEFVKLATILPLDKDVTQKAIELRRQNKKLKLGDAIIGATAIVNQLLLVTNNTKDFMNIKGLKPIDPHTF